VRPFPTIFGSAQYASAVVTNGPVGMSTDAPAGAEFVDSLLRIYRRQIRVASSDTTR
jgi:hypothetical protein